MTLRFFDPKIEYAKDLQLKKQDVEDILAWAIQQPHLPRINEVQAILFVTACYYNVQVTKQLIEKFYTMRAEYPKFFKNRNPLKAPIREALDVALLTPLAKKTHENYKILIFKLMDCNPTSLDLTRQFKIFDMICMLHLHQDGPSEGHIAIIDMAGAVWGHLFRVPLFDLRSFMFYVQEAIPGRIKRIHFVNVVPFIDKFMGMIKPLIKRELAEIIFLHKDYNDLERFVPRDCLPKDCGGSDYTMEELHRRIKQRLFENDKFFEWDEKQEITEFKKRKSFVARMNPLEFNAQKQYEKNPDLKKSDVESLQDWCKKQPHLPDLNEFQIILFLHSCYYSNESAKKALDNFFTVRTLCSDIFGKQNISYPDLKKTIELSFCTVLPEQTPDGCNIILLKILDSNPDNFYLIEYIQFFDMVTMMHLYAEGTSSGHTIIIDLENVVFGHLSRLGINGMSAIKKMFFYFQEAMPLRIKGFHLINPPPLTGNILALIKPFMKNELLKMLNVHNSIDDLGSFVPLKCLPENYGGATPPLDILHKETQLKLFENSQFFAWQDKQIIDETKRLKQTGNYDEIFGTEGTFKKLEID